MEINRFKSVIIWRSIVYLLLTLVIGFFANQIFLNEGVYSAVAVFGVLAVILLAQIAIIPFRVFGSGVVALLFADLFFTMILVRATGGSASPFIVLYPVITLAGSFAFKRRSFVVVMSAAALILMALSVGFTVSILGNGLAIAATTILGRYLVEALDKSDGQLKVSEAERKRLENIQKSILANIPSGLLSVDSSGRVIQINKVGERILGIQEDVIMGSPITKVMPQIEDDLLKLSTMVPVLSSDTGDKRRSLKYTVPSTSEVLNLGYTVVRLTEPESNRVLGSLIVFQDLTEVMHLESQLRQSEKLAAVGKLSAGIAHEIRNPLASITGSAQLLMDSKNLDTEEKSLMHIIEKESFRLDSLITDFLQFVKPDNLKKQIIDLKALAKSLAESLEVNPKWKSMNTNLKILDCNVKCSGDEDKLRQVLLNLILNSGQAGATEVVLDIKENASIVVSDNGSGIDSKDINRIFEPFFTTKDSGTGLGLSVSYKLIESMGGGLSAQSPALEHFENCGTSFKIKLKKRKGS